MDTKGLESVILKTIKSIGELTKNSDQIDIDILRDETDIDNLTEKVNKPKSLAAMFPEIAKDWNIEKNGRLTPDQITYGSQRKVWWKCKECGYEWKATLNSRTNGTIKNRRGCPNCSRMRKCSTCTTQTDSKG